jgi:hypothetical protein
MPAIDGVLEQLGGAAELGGGARLSWEICAAAS